MSRDPAGRGPAGAPGPDDERDPGRPGDEGPRLAPTAGGVLLGWASVGLIGGWLLHRVALGLDRVPPLVTWAQAVTLLFLAVVVGLAAFATHRVLHVRGERLPSHQSVNRLLLARATSLVGSLLAGGYAGYALSWLGLSAELAGQRALRAALAALAAALLAVAGLLLERACRVREDDDDA